MSRYKIKRRIKKTRPRGKAAMQKEINSRRGAIENMRLLAKLTRKKEEEAEKEVERVQKLEETAKAVAEIIKEDNK